MQTCGAARCQANINFVDLTGEDELPTPAQSVQAQEWKTTDLSERAVRELQQAWSETGVLGHSLYQPSESMSVASFKKLRPGRWLTDECINMFFAYLQGTDSRTLFMSTYFKNKLQTDTPLQVRAVLTKRLQTARLSFRQVNQILIPCNLRDNHWTLVSIRTDLKTILHYDSLGGSTTLVYDCLNWMQTVHADEGLPFNRIQWTVGHGDSPVQTNGFDCGVFLCATALFLRAHLPLNFTAEQMPRIRQRLASTILSSLG